MHNTKRKQEKEKVQVLTGDYDAWLHQSLQNKEEACAHIQAALEIYQADQNAASLLLALKDVAKAQGGIGALARSTALNREHLYYLLSGKATPRLDTLSMIVNAFGLKLQVTLS